MVEQKYSVRLDNFEGPMDLLLHLIDKHKLDIYDIPIASITEQYLAFLAVAQEMDLEIASEFLLTAATLINIKVKMLLPKKIMTEAQVSEDPRDELVARLLEYKFYKEAALVLKKNAEDAGDYFLKEIDVEALSKDFPPANPVANISLAQLLQSFEKVILHIHEEPTVLTFEKEEFYVEVFMKDIIKRLKKGKGLEFTALFTAGDSKRKIITIFMALLELCKMNQVEFQQNENFGVLWIFPKDDCEGE